jgi:tRNA(fMet)-specific endonuclease VapC
VILLDTDHLSVLCHRDSPGAAELTHHLTVASDQPYGISIISVIEQFRGWSAEINRAKELDRDVWAYGRLSEFVEFIRRTPVLPFDDRAAQTFQDLRSRKVRIGSMDLRIAAIAQVNDALLLTANLREFGRVPGLRVENWLRP